MKTIHQPFVICSDNLFIFDDIENAEGWLEAISVKKNPEIFGVDSRFQIILLDIIVHQRKMRD